jgi:uncharacterized protein YciI
MKLRIFIVTISLLFSTLSLAQQTSTPLDTALIRKLGADEYGQKNYVMGFLKRGPTKETDSTARDKIFHAHLQNIVRLMNEGKIVLAGPYLDDTDLRGVFVFNVATVDEARQLCDTDPAVKGGYLIAEFHPWYGSAALQMIPEWHKKIQAKSF